MIAVGITAAAFYVFGYYRMAFVYAGLLLQIAYLLSRGVLLGRLPIVGPHDTLFFLSASTVLFSLPFFYRLKERQKFLYPVLALAVLFMALALLYRPHSMPLPPVLKTFWFEVHVTLSFFSYALFAIGAVLGALYFRGVEESEALQYKSILVGYFLFSTAMVFGGIWAYLAWGAYWLWTPKELWTSILWLLYSLYLHARLRKQWAKPAAGLGIAGFFVVMFTYLGVSLLMKSSHTF